MRHLPHYLCHQMLNEMCGIWGAYRWVEVNTGFKRGLLRERHQLEDLGVVGKTILKQ